MSDLSSANNLFRVALVGYGESAKRYHVPLVAFEPLLEITAVVTSNANRAEQVRQDLPDAKVFSSVATLLSAADDFDLVVVATPAHTHHELVLAALSAGLPVVVEKPFTSTAAEARNLVSVAEERGLLLTVFQNRRWDPPMLTAKSLLAEGRLGMPVRCELRIQRWDPGAPNRVPARRDQGVLFDLGSHMLDRAVLLLGDVESVYAEPLSRSGRVDDDVFVALTHRTGAHSHIWMSVYSDEPKGSLKLIGDQAVFAIEGGSTPSGQPWHPDSPPEFGSIIVGDEPPTRVPAIPSSWQEFYREVARDLAGGEPTSVRPSQPARVIQLLEACFESDGRRVVEV